MSEQSGQSGQSQEPQSGKRTFVEDIELEGRQLMDRVRDLIQEGNVRRLIIKDPGGKYNLEIPLTVGVVAGGVFALAAPVMAALGALAALVSRVQIQVVREMDDDSKGDGGGI
ncbi:MAG: DUF4342 domain-containing protein [Anaerolineae bacterium]|jgi:hypothetical protein|nr:DUF4342 domain-containing protein [Anaerolineae bacterium]